VSHPKNMQFTRLAVLAAIIGGVMLTPTLVMAQGDWAPSNSPPPDIQVPFDAIVAGHEAPGSPTPSAPLYVCRAGTSEGYGQQVGKFRKDFAGCDFGFGGREVTVPFRLPSEDIQFLVTHWQWATDGAIPANAVVGGYDAPAPGQSFGPPLYYCRATLGQQESGAADLQLGKIRSDFGACFIPYGGQEVHAPGYQVLVHGMPYTTVTASNGVVPPDAIRAGQDDDGTDLYVCNAFFGGGQQPGKLRSSFRGCDISWGGEEHIVSTYQVLVPEWSGYPPLREFRDAFDFPAGKDINGAPLYVCRASYLGSVQPGKTQQGWSTCNFGYGGKEIMDPPTYNILSSLDPVIRVQ
jgi:hypothetical protein